MVASPLFQIFHLGKRAESHHMNRQQIHLGTRASPVNLAHMKRPKGGAVVVWRSDLCKEEALRQLSDTSFYAKVEKDLTANNQKIVKDTIQNLIVKQELPATATNLIITRTSCVCGFYPKSTNLIIRVVLSFLPAVVSLN